MMKYRRVQGMIHFREKKYNTAEILMYFRNSSDRDRAFGVLLNHDEDVYRYDEHYGPAFPGADRKGAKTRGLVIYAEIYEDVDSEVPEFIEDMQSILPTDIVEYVYNPISYMGESGVSRNGRMKESISIGNGYHIDDISLYDEQGSEENAEISRGGQATGDVEILVTLSKNGSILKEVWEAGDCKGTVGGYSHGDAHLTSDPYYSDPGYTDYDAIEWYDCDGDIIPGEYLGDEDADPVWDDYFNEEMDGPLYTAISKAIYSFIQNGCVFKGTPSEKKNNSSLKESSSLESIEDFENPYRRGDILVSNAGYTQIIPEFWEVVKVSPKSVLVKKLESRISSHDGYGQSGYKVPEEGEYKKDYQGKEIVRRLTLKLFHSPNQTEREYLDELSKDPKRYSYLYFNGREYSEWDGHPVVFDLYD